MAKLVRQYTTQEAHSGDRRTLVQPRPALRTSQAVGARRKAPNPGDGLFYAPGEDVLYLVAGGETDVAVRLRAPRSMRGLLKETEPASRVHLAVDEPDGFVRALRERMVTAVSDGAGRHTHPVCERSLRGVPGIVEGSGR